MRYCIRCMNKISEQTLSGECPFCHEKLSMDIPPHHIVPGTILNHRYYVGAALGQGGFGITYIGRDLNLDMRVAIKEFYPTGYVNRNHTMSMAVLENTSSRESDFFGKGRERFLKEARVLAQFSSEPGIVNVRDYFEENNTAYIIMEYLDGITLKEYLEQKGPLQPEKALELLTPLMSSLKKIHKAGVIHRDISPDNIMLVEEKVKLLDFGAAREVSNESRSLSIMLKQGYAPQEQYRSHGKQGAWTDVYAISAVLYKCITGKTPLDALDRMAGDVLETPYELGVNTSENFERVLMKGLALFPKDRYQSIDEMLHDFEEIYTKRTYQPETDGDKKAEPQKENNPVVKENVEKLVEPVDEPETPDENPYKKSEAEETPGVIKIEPKKSALPNKEENRGGKVERDSNTCLYCGKELESNAKFCIYCGKRVSRRDVCPKCGNKTEPGAKFCTYCGTSLAGKGICLNCGKELEPDAKFCIYCGAAVN